MQEENIDAYYVGEFALYRNTDMYLNPEQYNIISVDEKDILRFQSHKNGEIINKETMLRFYHEEYYPCVKRHFANGDRYTLYFE